MLGKVREFKGFPNTDYYILPRFFGNYLVLYKLGLPDKIPYDELPLSRRIGDMLAVPLVGYPVEFCQEVKILGSNNIKETLKFRPVCKVIQITESEGYIRLWKQNKQVFQYQQKLDFFPRNFFEGKWLYFQTFVRSPSVNVVVDIKNPPFEQARLVTFQASLGKLDVVEVNDLEQDDEKRVLFIPVEWRDYEVARDSEYLDSSFSERHKDVDEINRAYLQVKFNELINNEFKLLSEGGKSLKSVVVTKDYISFDMEVTTKGRVAYLVKYAFKRYIENEDYREKKWFKTDKLFFFPLHAVTRKYYEEPTDHTLLDLNRFKRVVRFDPQSEEIVWHFSKQSSRLPWVRNLAYEAERLLNKAFQQAGRDSDYKIKVTLDKSDSDKELGDIRYNILNLILSESEEDEHFVRGENVVNSFTGEVVSAIANIWLTPILNDSISLIRRYIRFHVYPPVWKMKPFSEDTVNFIYEKVDSRNLQCNDLSQEPQGVTPFLHEKINMVCKEVSDFIKENQGQVFQPKDSKLQDDDIVSSCAQKLARERILRSILKQMLHSLGLKNMLSASFDIENFYKKSEIEELFGENSSEVITASHPDPPKYSSVMDVMDMQYPVLSVPGKLDIAVLRFLYFDKVDLKEKTACCPLRKEAGAVLEVPSGADRGPDHPQKSILETALDRNYKKEDIKSYKICGPDNLNPVLCGEGDYGTSHLEIASNKLCQIHNRFLFTRNRYEAKDVTSSGSDKLFLINMYTRWQKYRDDILAREGQSILDYSFLNPDHIAEYNQKIEKLKEISDIEPYFEVRNLIFDYLKRLAFTPAKHCIYREDNSSRYKAIALENIEEKILLHYSEISKKER